MKILDKIKMAWNDILNRKFRSILTVIAISIGALLLVVMMGLGDGIMEQNKKMLENFGDVNEISIIKSMGDMMSSMDMSESSGMSSSPMVEEGSEEDINNQKALEQEEKVVIGDKEIEKLEGVDGVDYVRAMIQSSAPSIKIDNGEYIEKKVDILGISFNANNDFSKELLAGSSFTNNEKEILIGEKYLNRIKIDNPESVVGKTITIKVESPSVNGVDVKKSMEIQGKIIGVIKKDSTYSSNIVMNSKEVEPIIELISGKKNYISENGYDSIKAYAKDGYDVSEVSNRITEECGYGTFSMALISQMLEVSTTIIKSILSVAGIIVLVVAALGLVNTMTMILQEKRKMIGVMRSVGAPRGSIRLIFIFQSFILGILGGILGTILSAIGIYIINNFVLDGSSFTVFFTFKNVLVAIIITLLISIIAGLIPSSKAAKLNVVQAVAEE